MKKQKITHKDRVLRHLRDFGSITSLEAFADYGITRLAAYIYLLRAEGYDIESVNECSENRYGDPVYYARYTLEVGV